MTKLIIQRIPIQFSQLSPLRKNEKNKKKKTKQWNDSRFWRPNNCYAHYDCMEILHIKTHKPIQRFDTMITVHNRRFGNDVNTKPINQWAQHKLLMPKLHNVQFDGTNDAIQIFELATNFRININENVRDAVQGINPMCSNVHITVYQRYRAPVIVAVSALQV